MFMTPALPLPARRHCDLRTIGDEDARNGLDEEDELLNIEYLVCGHFRTSERDVKGNDGMRWISLSELQAAFEDDDAALDAALAEWEERSVRACSEALRRLRAPA